MHRSRGAGVPQLAAAFGVLLLVTVAIALLLTTSGSSEADEAHAAEVASVGGGPAPLDSPPANSSSGDAERAETTSDPTPASEPASQPGGIPADATGVTGRVIGRDGKPQSGVKVIMQRWVTRDDASKFGVTVPDGKQYGVFERAGETGVDGRFVVIDLIPDGSYSARIRTDDGLLGRSENVDVVPKLVRELGDIPLVRGARVSGLVRIEGGGPVAGAEISLGWQTATPIVSDAEGRFDAGTIFPGRQQIRVKARGYGLAESMQRELVAGDVVNDLEIVLVPAASITGHVVDAAGRGIPNAYISCDRNQDNGFMDGWAGDYQYTGPDGAFAFESTPPGTYSLWVDVQGYAGQQKEGIVAGGPPIQIQLKKASSIEGRVLDKNTGDGVRPTKVTLEWIPPWNSNEQGATFEPFWSDVNVDIQGDGRFSLGLSEAGKFRVVAEAEGFATGRSEPFDLGAESSVTGILVRLEPGAVLTVTVTALATRAPVEGAIVELFERQKLEPGEANPYPPDYTGTQDLAERIARAPTDATGVARLESLKPGDFVVIASKRGFARGRQNDVHIDDGKSPPPIALALGAGGGIEGRVFDHRNRPEPALRVRASGSKGESGDAVSVEDGRYRIENLAPGRYRVGASVEDGSFVAEAIRDENREIPETERFPLVVTEGAFTQFDVRVERQDPGTLAGTVMLNGVPAQGVTVMANRIEASGRRRSYWRFDNQAKTDQFGGFRFRRLRPGNYHLTVHRGWRNMFEGCDTVVQSNLDSQVTIDIALGSVTGRVVDGDGKPLKGAEIMLQKKQPPGQQQMYWFGGNLSAESDADGRFTIEDVQAGAYVLNATMRGFQRINIDPVEVAGRRATGPLDVVMKKGGWIRVRLEGLAPNQYDSTWCIFNVSDESGNIFNSTWERVGADGFAWVEMSKPAGTLTVNEQSDNGLSRSGSSAVKMEEGANAEVTVVLQ